MSGPNYLIITTSSSKRVVLINFIVIHKLSKTRQKYHSLIIWFKNISITNNLIQKWNILLLNDSKTHISK